MTFFTVNYFPKPVIFDAFSLSMEKSVMANLGKGTQSHFRSVFGGKKCRGKKARSYLFSFIKSDGRGLARFVANENKNSAKFCRDANCSDSLFIIS